MIFTNKQAVHWGRLLLSRENEMPSQTRAFSINGFRGNDDGCEADVNWRDPVAAPTMGGGVFGNLLDEMDAKMERLGGALNNLNATANVIFGPEPESACANDRGAAPGVIGQIESRLHELDDLCDYARRLADRFQRLA